jgi:drug/metabolite transporter (DMT)-like permease
MESVRAVRASRATLVAFGALVVLVGANVVAIRFSNRELPPLWGAGIRFALAALIFWALVVIRRSPVPRGRAFAGAALYGLLGFAAFFAFLYFGLVRASAGLGQIVTALVPLLTMLLAVVHGLERLHLRAVGGGIIAVAGIALVFGGQSSTDVPLPSMLSLLAAAVAFAETGVVAKSLPPGDPIATNAIATTVGAAVLLIVSAVAKEPWIVPQEAPTWVSTVYLVTLGTVVVFLLFLYLTKHWNASSVSYQFLFTPFVGVLLGALLLGEPITPVLTAGGALVLIGVYVGAVANPSRGPTMDQPARGPDTDQPAPPRRAG